MRVELISIGNELLLGFTTNTNAAFLSRKLSEKGYEVSSQSVIADEPQEIRNAFQQALVRASLVIATGGLGPTLDDRTLESAKTLFSEAPQELKNRIGMAPGALFFSSGKMLLLLPGVPREMEAMFLEEALPHIESRFPSTKSYFQERISLCLLKEREVDPFLRELQNEHPDVNIGIYPALGILQIVFRSEKPLSTLIKRMQKKFPTFCYGEGRIEEAVHRELIVEKKTLALAESCTGGAIAAHLTAIPDASAYLLGSLVAYSNTWKEYFLHVSHSTLKHKGAVSKEAVIEMVEGLFAETSADFAIAVSGIAGPGGGSVEKPVGTIYLAVGKRGERIDAGRIQGFTDRAANIDLTVHVALGTLWRRLVHHTFTLS